MGNILAFMIFGGILIGAGICLTSLLLFIIGFAIIFIPMLIGSVQNSFTEEGRKNNKKYYNREKEIEKNFGDFNHKK